MMEIKLTMDFWFDGIDDCTDDQIKMYLIEMLDSGAESTCSEVEVIKVENESGAI